jgi:hypothetical protein
MDQTPPRPSGAGRPQTIGRYRIIDRLGKGAMGVVYAAVDDMMDRQVAIKVMMADIETEPEARTRFYREARIAGQLMHRNIVTVFDLGEEDGRPYIVMELLKGLTLGDYLSRQEGLSLDTKLDLMIQVCEGLAVAHSRQVFHRDIKPGNLFVQEDGCLKILDFGIARLMTSTTTATGLVVGTPHYMSPEQAHGEEIDGRADVFSTGAVFYFLLSGQRPFTGPDLPAVIHRVRFEDPAPLPEATVPAPLARIVFKALSKRPSNRQQSISKLKLDLETFRSVYDLKTRRLAESLAERCRAIDGLLADVLRSEIELGLKAPGTNPTPSAVRGSLCGMMEQSAGSPLVVPFRREELAAMGRDLEREYQELLSRQLVLRAGLADLRVGIETLAGGDPRLALSHFDAATRAVPDSPVAQQARERCQAAVAAREAKADQVRTDLAGAKAAAEARRWSDVIRHCSAILEIDPACAEARTRRDLAREALARESRALDGAAEAARRNAEAAELTAHAAAALAEDPRAAAAAAAAALELEPGAADARDVLAKAFLAVHLAGHAESLAASARRQAARARELLATGALGAAAAAATRACAVAEDDEQYRALLLEILRAESHERIVAERNVLSSRGRQRAAALLASASACIRSGDGAGAAHAGGCAAALDPDNPDVAAILSHDAVVRAMAYAIPPEVARPDEPDTDSANERAGIPRRLHSWRVALAHTLTATRTRIGQRIGPRGLRGTRNGNEP